MKQRILSSFMALVLCLSLLPTAAFAQDEDEGCAPSTDIAVCTCETVCTDTAMNTACPICGAENAQVTDCSLYTAADPEPETLPPEPDAAVAAVQRLVIALSAADALNGMSMDELNALYEDVQAAWDAFDALTEEQQATLAAEESTLYELLAAINGYVQPVDSGSSVSYIEFSWNEKTKHLTSETKDASGYTVMTSEMTEWNTDWYVASGDVTIDSRVTVAGDVRLILVDNANLTVNGGIAVNKGNTFTVYAQSQPVFKTDGTLDEVNTRTGKLTAQNAEAYHAAIGGDRGACGEISIHGGMITASGGYEGAGIGGSWIGAGGEISIYGGMITTSGGKSGAGIGGSRDAGGEISIYGGTVAATGGEDAAGIGGGRRGEGGEISIHGGTVAATGGEDGAGIGSGCDCAGGTISIHGGMITAKGGNAGAGIGGGSDGAGGTISIHGGMITAIGSSYGAGIGGGYKGAGGEISICGGTITATGGEFGAGIGGGYEGPGGKITIRGGTITGTGGSYGAGIGGGYYCAGGTISFHGGTITAMGGINACGTGGGYHGPGGTISIYGGQIKAAGGAPDGGPNSIHACAFSFVPVLKDNALCTLFAGDSLTNLTQVNEPTDTTYTGSKAVHVDADHDFVLKTDDEITHICEKCRTVTAHSYIPNPDDETTHLCKGCGVNAKHAEPVLMADATRHTISNVCEDCLKAFGTFTLTAPTGPLTYDGNAKTAAVTGTIAGVATPEITYALMDENEEETALSSAPVSAGTYRASIACGSGADAVSVGVTYTINKAAPTIQLSIEDWVAGSMPSTPIVTGNVGNGGEHFQYKGKNEDDSTYTDDVPTEVGAYTIRVTVSETENYTQASDTADFSILAVAAIVAIDGTITQYASFADALTYANAATGTPTLTLLADCTQESAQAVSRSMILDLNGKELSGTTALTIAIGTELTLTGAENSKLTVPVEVSSGKLTVDDAVALSEVTVENYGNIVVNANAMFGKLSFNGGTATLNAGSFTAISVGTDDNLNDSITLGEGKALRGSDKWYTSDSLKVDRLSNVSVQAIPIRDLTIVGPTSGTYNMEAALSPTYTDADGTTVTVDALPEGVTINWYIILGEYEGTIASGGALDFAYNYSPGTHTFRCKVTVDGYTASADITITITRAALPDDITVTLTRDGETLRIGDTLAATVDNLPTGETLSDETTYTYYVDNVAVEGVSGDTLTIPSGSAGKTITVTAHIVTENYAGDATSAPTAEVQKKEGPTTAIAPNYVKSSSDGFTTSWTKGQEYAISTTRTVPTSGWQKPETGSVIFTGLSPNTWYYICYRVAETEDTEAGTCGYVQYLTKSIAIPDDAIGTLAGYTGTYDGTEHDAVVGSAAAGYTVVYSTTEDGYFFSSNMPKIKDAGTTVLWVRLSQKNYETRKFKLTAACITAKTLTADMIVLDDSQDTYDGTEKSVKFTIKDGTRTLELDRDFTVKSGDTTINAGNTLTIEGMGNYTGTTSKLWSLQKRIPEAADFTVNGLNATYDGTAKAVTATLNSPMTGAGDLTVYYEGNGDTTYTKSTTAPTCAGSYTVTLDVAEGTNFNAASGLSLGTLTISAATQTIAPADNGRKTIIKNGADVDISTWASSNAGAELTYTLVGTPAGITLSGTTLKAADADTTAASFTIKVSADAVDVNNDGTPEYSVAAEQTISVTVVERQSAGVTISNAPASKTYGDSFTVTASVGTGVTGGTWSWTTSDDSILAITGGSDSATVTVEAKKADTTGAKLTVTYTSNTHYGTVTTAAIPVAKKAISITGVSATARDYDGTKTVALTGGELVGKVTGDDLSFILGTGTMSNANAGKNKPVTTSISLTGTAKDNYTLTQPDDITVTIRKVNPDYIVPTGLTATYGQTLADVDLTDHTGWSWMDDTLSVGDASDTAKNFKAAFTPTNTTNYNVMSNIDVPVTVGKAAPTAPTGLAGLKGNALSTVTLPDGWTWDNSATVMDETKEYPASYAGSANYDAMDSISVTVTVSDKQPQVLTVTMDGWTYGEAANTPQYTVPEGAASLTIQYKGEGTADSTYTATVPTNAGEYTVRISYETATEIWIGSADFTIAKITPTGEPKYTAITTSGKTLADAALTTEGSTFSVAGSVKWVGEDGNELTADTKVEVNKEYRWLFTPTDTDNYNTISGSIKLWSRASGGGGGSYTPSYTITVEQSTHGTISVSPKSAKSGETVTITVSPDKGYDLEKLTVLDKNGKELSLTNNSGGRYTFKMPASAVTVKAVFAAERMENPFVDVSSGAYYENAVLWALKNGVTGGIDKNHFGPDLDCTRAQLVTFLWRAAGSPVVSYTMDFTDVGNSYYTEAVRWAASLGIVGGYGNGLFGTEDTITREQMATILYRFAQSVGMDTANGGTAVREFADYESISGYASEAMQWAVSAGILQGYNNRLMPSQPCTRAQIVTMLYRLLGE